MNDDRRSRLNALADWHEEWVTGRLSVATKSFESTRRKKGSDYNQHHVDLDADDDAFHRRAREIMGITS